MTAIWPIGPLFSSHLIDFGYSVKRKILVVCNDVVGNKMAGPAIRCVEISKILSSKFDVTLATPRIDENMHFPFTTCLTSESSFKQIAGTANVLIIQGDALRAHPFLKKCKGVLIADLYCPIALEYHQVSDGLALDVRSTTSAYLSAVLLEQLAYADHFLCASEKQREFWLGALTLAGRINAYRWPIASHANISDLISLLPFGLNSKAPQRERKALRSHFGIPEDDFVLVWGGGVYQWLDPLTIIKAIGQLIDEGQRVHLVFVGVKHPNPAIGQHDMCGRAVALATELGLMDKYVHFNFGWVDYRDRHNFLLDADVGVSAHFDNPETRFSFRTRMLDYLWCGLPIMATKGDVFGDSLDEMCAGVSIDFEDVDGWILALRKLMSDRELMDACRSGSANYSRVFRWDVVVQPLLELCSRIEPSPDRGFSRSIFAGSDQSFRRLGIGTRIRHIYATGGIRSLVSAVFRRIGRVLHL